jgi:sterol 14alpha-demethylase
MIEDETVEYFKRWDRFQGEEELFHAIAELTIMTASRCLMGAEIRAQLDETVAKLYNDLDKGMFVESSHWFKGFTPLNFLFPNLPLPSYRRRDQAHIQMRDLFLKIMKERRTANQVDSSDMLAALMDSEYRDGRKMTDREVACLMIALLMAGQHTSSTTGTWCLSYLAANPECKAKLLEELKEHLGKDLNEELDYSKLKSMTYLDNCIRETLRLKPPIITLMRKVFCIL